MQRAAWIVSTPAFSSVRLSSRTIAANTTATTGDSTIRCNAAAGAITVNLPPAASVPGLFLVVKKIDSSANVVTLDPNGSEAIDGGLTIGLSTQWQSIEIQSNGASWDVLSTG